MQMHNGRLERNEGRLDKEKRAYDLLDALGIEYGRIDHEAGMTKTRLYCLPF